MHHSTSRKGISVRTIFVILSLLQVTICAILCCYLGYLNAVKVTEKLSSKIFDHHFESARLAVDDVLGPLITATDSLMSEIAFTTPVALSTGIVRSTAGFWYHANKRFRRQQVQKIPIAQSQRCKIGQVMMAFLPGGPTTRFAIQDRSTGGNTVVVELNFSAASPVTDWRTIEADISSEATFDSLLNHSRVLRVQSSPDSRSPVSYLEEVAANGANTMWFTPQLSYNRQLTIGTGRGVVDYNRNVVVGACVMAVTVSQIRQELLTLSVSPGSKFLMATTSGRLLLASDDAMHSLTDSSRYGAQVWMQNITTVESVPQIAALTPLLMKWGLVSTQSGALLSSPPCRTCIYSAELRIEGKQYHVRAGHLQADGFDGFIVTLAYSADFDSGSSELLTFSTIVGTAVLAGSIALTLAVVHVVWRKVDQVVQFMKELDEASLVPDNLTLRSRKQSESDVHRVAPQPGNGNLERLRRQSVSSTGPHVLCTLLRKWNTVSQLGMGATTDRPASLGDSAPEVSDEASSRSDTAQAKLQEVVAESRYSLPHSSRKARLEPPSSWWRGWQCWCCRSQHIRHKKTAETQLSVVGWAASTAPNRVPAECSGARTVEQSPSCVSFQLAEPALMRRTFGAMLHSLCAFQQETMRANQAKQHFIRYIFHEVRVPFNSVVLCKCQTLYHAATAPI